MKSLTEILNQGEQLKTLVAPDNKNTFAITDEDCAFINSINMQLDMLKTFTISMISHIESQMEAHTALLDHFKNNFMSALADKHGVDKNNHGSLSINLENKLFIHNEDDK